MVSREPRCQRCRVGLPRLDVLSIPDRRPPDVVFQVAMRQRFT